MAPLLPVVKLGGAAVAGIPVSKIVNDIIRNNVTIVTKVDKIKVASGSVVIGAMISQQLSKTTDMLVDSIVNLRNHTENEEETEKIDES
jgi:hypothetical protein